ncbi:MAG: AAA family ATPase [Elusimicrobiota bacterium]
MSSPLPFVHASELAREVPEKRWLLEGLWAASGVGLLGGCPKVGKSWLGLEMAVSVASGTPCLGAFAPSGRGRALIYMAEDADPVVRERLESLCRYHRVRLEDIELFVITVATLRIDIPDEQQRLSETMARLKPTMLLLDPLIRLHRANENDSGEVSAILAYLRGLQRQYDAAVVLVHHVRKSGSNGQPGQALRGSGDWHAFGDSNLYLQRRDRHLLLTIEHRAARSPEPITLQLVEDDPTHLEITDTTSTTSKAIDEAIVDILTLATHPMTRGALRDRLRTRNERVGEALDDLERRGLVRRVPGGWALRSFPFPPNGSPGTERSDGAR